jgi:hypothetical protein
VHLYTPEEERVAKGDPSRGAISAPGRTIVPRPTEIIQAKKGFYTKGEMAMAALVLAIELA